jgi:putative nucleotidyltransferase with HDIG domain
VSLAQVAKLLEHDAMLCGEVLRAAQSPMYSRGNRLTSIQQALSILGMGTLRDIVIQVATSSRVFRAKAYQKTMEELRTHSMVVAHASRIVCRYTSLDAEYAFMCGLLHDVGKAGALIVLAENVARPPPLEDVWHAIEDVHAEASQVMARQWGLAAEVSLVVGAHHTVRIEGYPHPLAAAISLADHLAKDAGYGCSAVSMSRERDSMPMRSVVETLRLTPKQLQLIGDDVEKAVQSIG